MFLVATLLGYCHGSAIGQAQVRIQSQIEQPQLAVQPTADSEFREIITSTQRAVRDLDAESSLSPRDHFKQIMRTYYTTPHTGSAEELASFFSISEMYRLGPLNTDPRVDYPPSILLTENSWELCHRMADRLNTQQSDTDYCHWTYTCNYNANRFPSMIINATECTVAAGVNAKCVARKSTMQTFTRTFVGVEATWRRDNELACVVYAYTCRRQY